MKKVMSFFVFTVMSMVAVMAAPTSQAAEATLTVNVSDEQGTPVEGAFVYYMSSEAETNAQGVATISGINSESVSGKKVSFSVYKDGYDYYEGEADFTSTLNAVANVTLSEMKFSLTVSVVSGDYEPVEGAMVTILAEEHFTNDKGKVELKDIPASKIMTPEFYETFSIPYTVYKDGYQFYEGEIYVEGEELNGVAILEAEEASATIKVVTGEDYDPVADATVTFQGKDYTTNEYGQVVITGLLAPEVLFQEVPFTVYKDGYDFYEGTIMFDMLEAQAIAQLVPAEATLKIKVVTGEENDPVAGATVMVNGKDYISGTNGEVDVTGLKLLDVLGKKLPFTVYKDGYEEFSGEADFTESMEAYAVATLIASEASVTIKVITGEENDPVADAMVTFMDKDYTTDEQGEVKIAVSAPEVIGKEIAFTAYKDGYDFFEGTIVFDMLEAWGIATLAPAKATISVKVITGEENDPVAEATVTINDKEYFTDANGEVKISNLNGPDVIGKEIPMTISKEGFETLQTVADFTETLDALVLAILVADPESGISEINAATADSKVYDLQGRIIAAPVKGNVYIINGKKVRLN